MLLSSNYFFHKYILDTQGFLYNLHGERYNVFLNLDLIIFQLILGMPDESFTRMLLYETQITRDIEGKGER